MEAPVEQEIVPGDPALRRKMLLAAPLILAIGFVALATLPRATRLLILWLQESPGGGRHAVLVMLAFAAPFTFGAWLVGFDVVRRSLGTLRTRRFPPPGMRVMRDTPVVRGGTARVLGILGLVLGASLLTAGAMLPRMAYRIGAVLRDGCPRAAHQLATPAP